MLTPTLTREQVATLLQCSHPELGQLLRQKIAPLPVRVDGVARWYEDEVEKAKPAVAKAIARSRARRSAK